jgi:hypothetical protein
MNLLFQACGFGRRVVVHHESRTNQSKHTEETLHKTLPGFDDWAFIIIIVRIEHGQN